MLWMLWLDSGETREAADSGKTEKTIPSDEEIKNSIVSDIVSKARTE